MINRRLLRPYLLSLTLMTVLVIFVHATAERSIIGEVRKLLAGVATTAAEGLMAMDGFAIDFQRIDGSLDPFDEHDPRHAAFSRMAAYLESVRDRFMQQEGGLATVPSISHVYTLRRVQRGDPQVVLPLGEEGESLDDTWQFVVVADWFWRDVNGDGRFSPRDEGAPPGLNYPEGLEHEEIELALQGPRSEREFHSDRWGTWLSGYAPLLDASLTPIGVLGVDLSRRDLTLTLLKIRLVSLGAWVAFVILVTLTFHLLSGRERAFAELERMDAKLHAQNDQLTATNRNLEAANQEFARQLELAKRVQQNFLPTEFPRSEKIAFGSIYMACEAIGGDIYDVFSLDEDHVGFYIADVSGHGISAALIASTLKMSVEAMKTAISASGHRRASILYRPRDMIIRLHNILSENLSREHFITMQYGVVSVSDHTITLCNAGHTWPVWWHAQEERAELVETNSGLPIGYVVDDVLENQEFQLEPGDKLVVYTDGLIESHGEDVEKMYGEERLTSVIAANGRRPAEKLVEIIRHSVDDFIAGRPSPDDVALIVAEFMPDNGR